MRLLRWTDARPRLAADRNLPRRPLRVLLHGETAVRERGVSRTTGRRGVRGPGRARRGLGAAGPAGADGRGPGRRRWRRGCPRSGAARRWRPCRVRRPQDPGRRAARSRAGPRTVRRGPPRRRRGAERRRRVRARLPARGPARGPPPGLRRPRRRGRRRGAGEPALPHRPGASSRRSWSGRPRVPASRSGCREALPGPATSFTPQPTFTASAAADVVGAPARPARRRQLLGLAASGGRRRRCSPPRRDPQALVAEDNLRVVPGFTPWVEAFARSAWGGGGAPFDEVLARWVAD